MYRILRENNIVILQRESASGKVSEILTITDTADGRILMIDKSRRQSYIVKTEDVRAELELAGNTYIGKFASKVNIYIRPHYQGFHNAVMTESDNRYSHANVKYKQNINISNSLGIDTDIILENMLECIASI